MAYWDHFTRSLLGTLLHSVWQSGLLLVIFRLSISLFRWENPQAKRNGLLFLLSAQLFLSVTSFLQLYLGFSDNLPDMGLNGMSSVLPGDQSVNMAYNLLAIIYLAVFGGKLIQNLIGWFRFRQSINQDFQKAPVDIRLFTKAKALELGIRRHVKIWLSEHIYSPMTFGYFKPVILFPVSLLNHISLQEAEALILHELSHIRRNDYLINWFILVMEQFFFFNPFTRALTRQFREEREMSCDMQVLDFRYPAVMYAEALLKTARIAQTPARFHLPAAEGHGELIRRIHFFTTRDIPVKRKNSFPARLLFLYMTAPVMLLVLGFIFNHPKNDLAGKQVLGKFPVNNAKAYTINNSVFDTQKDPKGIRVMYIDEASVYINSENKKTARIKNTSSSREESTVSVDQPAAEIKQPEEVLTAPGYHAIPVSAEEQPVEDGKAFIIREENPATGTITTKAYRIIYADGQWKNQFLWMTTETKPQPDSIRIACDSTEVLMQ